jgi:capsular polysaccharide biosynthesis protein
MTAGEAVQALRERWWVVLVALVAAGAAAYTYVKLPWVEPRWRSSVLIQATGRLDYGNFLALEKELRPLAEQVRQLSVMREVDRNLHTDLSASRILEHTRAEPVQDSGQIRLDVEDSDPRRAEQLSLEIADVYTRQHNAAEQGKLREERVILSTLDRDNAAILIWPQTKVLVAAAALLGLIVGVLAVLLQRYFDPSIRTANDVERYLELPLMGIVPRHQATGRHSPVGKLAVARAAVGERDDVPAASTATPSPTVARR